MSIYVNLDTLHFNILKLTVGELALPTSIIGISPVKVCCVCCVPMTRPDRERPVPMKPLPSCSQPPTTSVQRLCSAVLCYFPKKKQHRYIIDHNYVKEIKESKRESENQTWKDQKDHWIKKGQPMSTESGGLRAPRPLATRSCSANAEVPLASFRGTHAGRNRRFNQNKRNLVPLSQNIKNHQNIPQPSQPVVILRQNALTVRTIHHYPYRSISCSTAACHHMSP